MMFIRFQKMWKVKLIIFLKYNQIKRIQSKNIYKKKNVTEFGDQTP